MFEFFSENELISHNQLGYKPGNLCINQLLCITHDIYQSLDDGLETRGVVFDISKAFGQVWHKVFSSSWSKMIYQVTFQMLSPIFSIRWNNVLFLMDSTHPGLILKQGSPRDLSLKHYTFWSISTTYLMTWLQILNYLGMIPLSSLLFII